MNPTAAVLRSLLLLSCASALLLPPRWAQAADQPPSVTLASNGEARLKVIVAEKSSERVRKAAATLAQYLGRICEAKFEVATGDGAEGIALGLPADFPSIKLDPLLDASKDPTCREDYVLRSHAHGVQLIGATELAVEHATWDLLRRLGYRQFFPGEHWEVVPRVRELSVAVDAREHPDYYARRVWYGFGAWDYAKQPYADWCARNRATSGIELHTGHAYDGILRANKAEFDKHPEYLGLVGGKRVPPKFCISNPGLRKLIVDHALREIAKKPDTDSISMDPSDGGKWCECESCARMGSVTDRALTLANDVAEAINVKHPGKLVGIYAYNYHSPPPAIRAHPQVVVSIATAFIKGGQTIDELIEGWSAKAGTLGIREYYSVNTWDRDQPAAARGGNIAYLQRTIPSFHARGARFMSAESSDNWGPNGLGYYLAAQMLWDVKQAKNLEALIDDFLTRAFGPAKEPMRQFYEQIDGSKPHLVSSDQLGRMFRAVAEARKLAAGDPPILARLDDLLLYCRYVDLYARYAKSSGKERQQAFEVLIRHAYRMRKTMLVHTLALYRDLDNRDKSVAIPPEALFNKPEPGNPWKSSQPLSQAELAAFLAEGIERNPLAKIEFKPVAFSENLAGVNPLKLPEVPTPGQWGPARGKQVFYTRIDAAPASIDLQITGGLIEHYRNRGNVRVELYKIGGASQTGERETLVAEDRSVPPDGKEHAVTLQVKEAGLYKLTFDDGQDRTLIKFASKLPTVIRSTLDEPMNSSYSDLWQLYFYVPRGTKVLGIFGGEHGEIHDSAGRAVFWLNGRQPNYYSVNVPDGEDGKVWKIRYGRGSVRLLTVPPYFARTPADLLLPVEVVEKDAPR